MSKERELLALILSYAGNKYLTVDEFEMMAQIEETFKEISELLAQPEQEPVAWMWDEMFCEDWTTVSSVIKPSKSKYVDNVRPLYLTPQKREPLSEDKLDALAEANITDEGIAGYYLGFRDAEKMHGITGVDDDN